MMGRSPEAAASGAGSIGETKQFDPIRHEQRKFMASTERFTSYPAYRESGVEWLGEIPAHWTCLSLARVTQSRCDGPFGSGLKSQHYSVDGVRVIRLQNIGGSEFLNSDQVFVDESHADTLGDHSVLQGDLLVAGLGDDAHPVGRACVAPEGLGRAMVKADCFRLRLDPKKIVPGFAAYQLTANALAASGYLATGSTRSRMNLSTTATRKIALPPIAEQHFIVSFLNRETAKFDAMVAKKERLIELLQEKRATLITGAVTKGIDSDATMKDSGIAWLGQIPALWSIRRLKRISNEISVGVVVNPSSYITEDGVPFVYGSDIREGSIAHKIPRKMNPDQSALLSKSRLETGDLVTVRVGAPGVTAVVSPDLEGANCASVVIIRRGSSFDSDWLCYVMNSRIVRYQVSLVQYGAAQEQFNVTHAVEFMVPTPPAGEQNEIAAFLDHETIKIDELIANIRKGINRFCELRTALISAAVTGKIDVRETPT